MKALVLSLCLLVTGCATVRSHSPFRHPDGTLDVLKVLQWVQYGIEADCQFGTSALTEQICTFGIPAVTGAMAVANRDPTGAVPAVRQILADLTIRIPTIAPYLDWALQILKG